MLYEMARTKAFYMFPSLHRKVMEAVSDDLPSTTFHQDGSNANPNKDYPTHVMGTFRCGNRTCSTDGWGSRKVAIQIRGYPKNGYNATVFNQRCKSCNQLGIFKLDEESYVDRVAYRLRKWAGIAVEKQQFTKKKGPPHETDFCEGCKRGICPQADATTYRRALAAY